MSEITKEYIEEQIANIQQQRTNAVNIVLQADGAILAYQDLLGQFTVSPQPVDSDGNIIAPPIDDVEGETSPE